MTLPAAGYLSNGSRTEAEMKTALEDQRDAIARSPGGAVPSSLTIATGAITPIKTGGGARLIVDTEGAVTSDDLDQIIQTNVPDGSILVLSAANSARTVVIKNGGGGSGQILTVDGNDFSLDNTDKWIMLRRSGSDWLEEMRQHVVGGKVIGDGEGQYGSLQVFTASGTWTKPDGLKFVEVEVIGGGGAGGGPPGTSTGEACGGAGGGAGGYARKRILTGALGSSETVTVGAGGAGSADSAGAAGGTTSFGTHVSATGGAGGSKSTPGTQLTGAAGGAGGAGASGDINANGGCGERGLRVGTAVQSTAIALGGAGGTGVLGGGGVGIVAAVTPSIGNDGVGFGGGGSGGANGESSAARRGGDGAAGICIVREYF